MKKHETPINGLYIIEPQVFSDERGWFFESYNIEKFKDLGIDTVFVQDNHSKSSKGVLRGIHFQLPPKPMAKLVRCTVGRIWDVAVDLRRGSSTHLKWFATELSAENKKMIYLPVGFGHGFYSLEESEVVYKCSNIFDSSLDANVKWNDSAFGIQWPLDGEPMLSNKDLNAPSFSDVDLPF